jgi:hypothetical protein
MSHDDERTAADNKPGRFPCSSSSPHQTTINYRTGGDAFPGKLLFLPFCGGLGIAKHRLGKKNERGAIGKSRGRRETRERERVFQGQKGTKVLGIRE